MAANVSPVGDDAITLDMVVRHVYCPRLFHLMYVDGRWEENVYTIQGQHTHRRVDQVDHVLPHPPTPEAPTNPPAAKSPAPAPAESPPPSSAPVDPTTNIPPIDESEEPTAPDDPDAPIITRSVPLASTTLQLTAKLDLVSAEQADAVPVETKRGRVPANPQRSHDTHRIQLMIQGLLLRENGYQSTKGVVYYAESKTRVDIPFTTELETQARQAIADTHAATTRTDLPPPLDHSPKCQGCSLSGICLPDETLALRAIAETTNHSPPPHTLPLPAAVATDSEDADTTIRRLYPPKLDALPLYIQHQGAFVGKTSSSIIVKVNGNEIQRTGIKDISQVVLCGNVQISSQAMQLLCEAGIPVSFFSTGMWFYGIAHGHSLKNAYDRAAQFTAAQDPNRCLDFAKAIVAQKIQNQRTLLRRNAAHSSQLDRALSDLNDLLTPIEHATSTETLLGLEGAAAARYFAHFADMLKPRDFDADWDFTARNRRPPKDPVNAMLSYTYALLVKECTVALTSEGLDPYWGFYHRPRHGRPALALDLMEPLRPVLADSVVVTAINTGMVQYNYFEQSHAGCAMNPFARKALLRAWDARLEQLVTHPLFDYRCSWRSIVRLQARLLSRWLRGDIPHFVNVTTR